MPGREALPSLPMTPETIRELIEAGLPGARAHVQGDDGVHFEALVICEAFAGKLPLARHRMVYATLGRPDGRRDPCVAAQDHHP